MLLLCLQLAAASPAHPDDDAASPQPELDALRAARELEERARAPGADPHGKRPLRYQAAASAYLQLLRAFPHTQHGPEALYSAAVLLEVAGEAQRARDLFTHYVTLYPDDERASALMFRIAASHQAALELDRAILYYAHVARSRDAPEAPSAQHSLAFLHAALGDHRRAAEGFERYARDYDDLPDARMVLALAGPHWEAVGAAEAEAFYRRLKDAGPRDEVALAAHHRLAVLQADPQKRQRAWEQLGALLQAAPESTGRSRYAALVMIEALEGMTAEWAAVRYPRSPEALIALLDREGPRRLAEQLAASQQLIATGDAVGVVAGLYFSGAGYLVLADMLADAPRVMTGEGPRLAARWTASAAALRAEGQAMLAASRQAAQAAGVVAVWVDYGARMLPASAGRIHSLSTPRELSWDDPHLALSRQHREAGDLLAATDALRLKLDATPEPEPHLHTALADLHSLQGRHTQARAALEQAVARDPTFVPALHRLAQLDLRCYRVASAVALLAEAAALAPDDPGIAADLARAEAHHDRTTRSPAMP